MQGLERYYALLITANRKARLVKKLDGETILAEVDFTFDWDQPIRFKLSVKGSRVTASLDGQVLFTIQDADCPLLDGGVGLVVEEGRIACEEVVVG